MKKSEKISWIILLIIGLLPVGFLTYIFFTVKVILAKYIIGIGLVSFTYDWYYSRTAGLLRKHMNPYKNHDTAKYRR